MLPALREELGLYQGPPEQDGAPTWSLQDPVRNRFFRIDWATFEILARWHLGEAAAIATRVRQETPIQVDRGDVEAIASFLAENELIQRHDTKGVEAFCRRKKNQRTVWYIWLLHRYLFFCIPLWRPDAFLTRTLAWVQPLFSRGFLVLTLLALMIGLIEVSRQWDVFLSSLIDMFSWEGLFSYIITLILVKFLHELGHAYTAKRFGCRVPTMGVAFMVMFPMAYTDVNEVWKLPEKRQRLAVSGAGIITELVVAAWATLAWTLLPDGPLKNAAFLLATTTWVSTVIINASPFMRFDGYFLLSDWLGMPNLHARTFALTRWRLREWLFSLGEPKPEVIGRQRERWIILYGWITWIYRLVVFGGIAALVYHVFPKPLGPILATIEVAWFIVAPVWSELKAWRLRIPMILKRPRTYLTLSLLACVLCALFVPWDTRVQSQGLLKPVELYSVFAPGAARIDSLPLEDGQEVRAGDLLMSLDAPELETQKEVAATRAKSLRWQVESAGVDPVLREQRQVYQQEMGRARVELHAIEVEQGRYALKAPFPGRFFLVNPDIQSGSWVGKNEKLAVVANTKRWIVHTYLPESELTRIRLGDTGRFYPETAGLTDLALRVERIDRDATRVLADAELSSIHGGLLPTREKDRQIVPEGAFYHVVLSVVTPHTQQEVITLRGRLSLRGEPKAWAESFMRSAAALFIREGGF